MVKRFSSGYHRKSRNSRERTPKRVLLIAPEGKNKTESEYFKNFNRDNVSIKKVSGNETSPYQLANRLIKESCKLQLQSDDLGICLVDSDFDKAKDSQVKEADLALQKASEEHRLNLKLIFSNPCFERWYLCHFSSSTQSYNSHKELIKELQKHIPSYKKSDNVYPEYLKGKTQIAINNAKNLERHCKDSNLAPHTVSFSPSTEVYKVFELFLSKWLNDIN